MKSVTVYTRFACPYCVRALDLFARKGVAVKEIDAGSDPARKAEMVQLSHGRATFPQIFIGDRHVGGCDDVMALDAAGRLDPMLQD